MQFCAVSYLRRSLDSLLLKESVARAFVILFIARGGHRSVCSLDTCARSISSVQRDPRPERSEQHSAPSSTRARLITSGAGAESPVQGWTGPLEHREFLGGHRVAPIMRHRGLTARTAVTAAPPVRVPVTAAARGPVDTEVL